MTDTLDIEIDAALSDCARGILQHIAWRGYLPPASEAGAAVIWAIPADQIDLLRSVLRRNRRLAGDDADLRAAVGNLCDRIGEESRQKGIRPDYGAGPGGFPS